MRRRRVSNLFALSLRILLPPQVPKDDEKVAGNPNTLYGFVGFNDSNYQLVPPDYPPFSWPPVQPSGASSGRRDGRIDRPTGDPINRPID